MCDKESYSALYKRRILNTFLKKFLPTIFLISYLFLSSAEVVCASNVVDFLCEIAIKYYERGNYADALHEFKKALLLESDNKTAQDYINKIEAMVGAGKEPSISPVVALSEKEQDDVLLKAVREFDEVILVKEKPGLKQQRVQKPFILSKKERAGAIKDALDRFEGVMIVKGEEAKEEARPAIILEPKDKGSIVKDALDKFEAQYGREDIYGEKRMPLMDVVQMHVEADVPREGTPLVSATGRKIIAPSVPKEKEKYITEMWLDDTVRATQPQTILNLQIDRDLIIKGKNIARFLVIDPERLEVERLRPNEILLKARKIGSTYLHVWDDDGRWTFLARISPFRPEGPTLAELLRRQAEEARSFKLLYSNEWLSFYNGRRLDSQDRDSISFYQSVGIEGQTPYGDLDSRVNFNKFNEETEVTYYTLGLEDGELGPFKGFDLRAFDYYVDFDSIGFNGANLRGAKFHSPAFQDKIDYTLFWGKEQQGLFTPLSPGITDSRDACLEGGRLSVKFPENVYQSFAYTRGYGSGREPTYSKDVYDYTNEINIGNLKLGSNVSHDGESLVYTLNSNYTIPKLQITGELRNIEDDFIGVTGRPYASGELGTLLHYRYNPSSNLEFSGRLDTYRDRLFPNPEHENRFNIDFNQTMRYNINPTTSLRVEYINNNDTGTISTHKDESIGVSLFKTIDFIKPISSYLSLRRQTSENPSSPTLNYTNNKVTAGLRFGLTDKIYYYVSKEFNWLEDYADDLTKPQVFDTGINYNSQISDSPFYLNLRLYYRDEENATGTRSFLSGEDNFEVQSELRYQPTEDFNAYINLRANNIWAENPDVSKRLETEVRFGARWAFDTGFKLNPTGNIAGLVFKDINSDKVHQSNEPLMKDIKVILGRDKYAVTDADGKYLFKKVSARKAFVYIDTSSLPTGFVLTGPSSQEVSIEQGRTKYVNFGIVSRSEVYGIIFNDLNGNGKFDKDEEGIKDVVLSLEDGTKTKTNANGQYYLRGITPGTHTLTLDINSLPVNLIPQVPVFKEIELFEGVTYIHNIPLKEVKK